MIAQFLWIDYNNIRIKGKKNKFAPFSDVSDFLLTRVKDFSNYYTDMASKYCNSQDIGEMENTVLNTINIVDDKEKDSYGCLTDRNSTAPNFYKNKDSPRTSNPKHNHKNKKQFT